MTDKTDFLNGNVACAEGALAAGCRFFAGYPITPSTEVAERMAVRLPKVGGIFIQMEDELASAAAIIGGSCAGARTMTATSGPGFSLMMENSPRLHGDTDRDRTCSARRTFHRPANLHRVICFSGVARGLTA